MRVLVLTLFLATPAYAQSYTFEASCIPDGPLTIDMSGAVGASSPGGYTYTYTPVPTSVGTFDTLYVQDDGPSGDFLAFGVTGSMITIELYGTNAVLSDLSIPAVLDLLDWSSAFYIDDDEGTFCSLQAITTTPASLLGTGIDSVPGFTEVLDSGPANLATEAVEDDLETLEAEAGPGCTTVRWAGTWWRGRDPRLSGLTDDGRSIEGTSITDATVAGIPFSASLASGGRFTGATEDGAALAGHFARVSSKKAIWYGVESICD